MRKRVKLTGGAHLSVAVGGKRVRERVIGPCGISWAGERSRPAVGVCVRARAWAMARLWAGQSRLVRPVGLAGLVGLGPA